MSCGFIKLTLIDSSLFLLYYIFFIFNIKLLDLKFYDFFLRDILILYYESCFNKFNPILLGLSLFSHAEKI